MDRKNKWTPVAVAVVSLIIAIAMWLFVERVKTGHDMIEAETQYWQEAQSWR